MKSTLDKFNDKMDKCFVYLGKFIGIVVPTLCVYGVAIYYGVKFAKTTDALTAIKLGFIMTWVFSAFPSISSMKPRTFTFLNQRITFGGTKEMEKAAKTETNVAGE